MLRVGIVGIGFMGWIHWLAYQQSDRASVSAIVSRDPVKRSGDWRGIQGNFGPPGTMVDLTGIETYTSLDELLADPQIDLVDICLPPARHAEMAERALRSGKHVFCEKPMALGLDECDAMLRAASESDRQLLIGHVLPFFPEYHWARQQIAGGEYGQVIGGHFKRVISDPTWIKSFYDPQVVGGPLLDLHVHDAHFIRMLLGMPQTVTTRGRMRGESVEYCATVFGFEDPAKVVSSVAGVIHQQGRPFTHGFEIHLERATIQFEFAAFSDESRSMPLTMVTEGGEVVRPELPGSDPADAFVFEVEEVVDAVQNGRRSAILDGQLARDAIELCHWQTASVQSLTSKKT